MADALVAAPPHKLPAGPVWGREQHVRTTDICEPADWLTLLRLLGWSATVLDWNEPALDASRHEVVVVVGDPGDVPPLRLERLTDRLRRDPVLIVGAAGGEAPHFHGCRLEWMGPGGQAGWTLPVNVKGRELETSPDSEVWATLDARPVVVARRPGPNSVIATVGLEPDGDWAPAVVAVLKRVLTLGSPMPTAWLDLAGTLVLRMDDPGGSPNVHLRSWSYSRLSETEWREIGGVLRLRGAHMSVAYTPGWLDDGDAERGTLLVGGIEPVRSAGAVHRSARVVHVDRAGNAPGRVNDYTSEYRGIERLRAEGLVSVELHGYTHVRADVKMWARAPDRYDEVAWYREFTPEADAVLADRAAGEHPVLLGHRLLRETFGVEPTTLVCPGDAWTPSTLQQALEAGLGLVSAAGLALRHDERFCWCAGVATVPLDAPSQDHFAAELPVVCRFHDLEPATLGVPWLAGALDEWRRLGARRLIDFRELSAALALRLRLARDAAGEWRLDLGGPRSLPRPQPVLLRVPGGPLPAEVRLERAGTDLQLPVQALENGLGRVVLPASA